VDFRRGLRCGWLGCRRSKLASIPSRRRLGIEFVFFQRLLGKLVVIGRILGIEFFVFFRLLGKLV
jgi:hypothetical protein